MRERILVVVATLIFTPFLFLCGGAWLLQGVASLVGTTTNTQAWGWEAALAIIVLLGPPTIAGYLWLASEPSEPETDVCESCGYDLRGTPGERCPECGAVRKR